MASIRPRTLLLASLLLLLSDPPGTAAATVPNTPCVAGFADVYACSGVDLAAHLSFEDLGGGFGDDVWGWTDPVHGDEISISGIFSATAFVDVTDPANPIHLGNLPTQTVSSFWHDIRVISGHAYVVSEAPGHGMQIFDMSGLHDLANPPATFSASGHYAGFGAAHNIVVTEGTPFAYVVGSDTCDGGLHMLDLSNPVAPSFLGCHDADGYVHDAQCVLYAGPDSDYQGREICVNSNVDHVAIVDVTDKASPQTLTTFTYPGATYTHQGWLTEDQSYFLLGDEEDELALGHGTRTYVFDLSDLDAPVLKGSHTSTLNTIDHNLYIRGNRLFEVNYTSGLRIFKMGDLAQAEIEEVGFFDTWPFNDSTVFSGAWGAYPFFESGTVVVNGTTGLFILTPSTSVVPECGDGFDNDSDGSTDGADSGCFDTEWPLEAPRCSDGIDNDEDQDTDFPNDTACVSAWDNSEDPGPCGLGAELALLLPLFAWGRSFRISVISPQRERNQSTVGK